MACRNAYCTTCRSPKFAEGLRSLVVLHIVFVPLLPIGTLVRWFCAECKKEIDARRPSRPWILTAGVFFGLLMTFVGVMGLIEGKERESAIDLLVFGPLMVVGLVYMIRKQDYGGYVTALETVEPLRDDRCPYCASPLFSSRRPHCHACKVEIVTQ